MTDYELVYLISESISNAADMFMYVFTIVSAYLVAAYAFARQISSLMYRLLNGIFIITYMIAASSTYATLLHMSSLNGLARERAKAGEGLEWNVVTLMPHTLEQIMIHFLPVIFIVILAAAIYFFHQSRLQTIQGSPEVT